MKNQFILISCIGLVSVSNGSFAQSNDTLRTVSSQTISNGVVIHPAQGVENISVSNGQSAEVKKTEQPMEKSDLERIIQDCEMKRDQVADPEEKKKYTMEIEMLRKKIAVLSPEKQ
jgi:hypothetical protein